MSDIFFSAGYFSPRNLFACFFPLEISLQDIFSEITHNPLKSQMVGPIKSSKRLVSWQILICQSFLKALETIGDKTLQGEGRNSFLLTPTRKVPTDVRMYGDVITKFSRMDSLPNFITHGAPLCALRARRLRYNGTTVLLIITTTVLTNKRHVSKHLYRKLW